ncbi:hypothetical protein P6281_06660 [Mycobacterium sp. 5-140-3-2]|uniref:hypothetical protein n=1 Tax=unclassified Mycobacterium TaxID=2642494 RepID=UPI002D78D5B9|nr:MULTISPECIES: hypothetical protein [unclassified Mycobacterium]WRU83600.1 hypothetical protein P6281_06660 [Mycobacterium sp. 5-140-3-2]WSE40254.1 hypothetical protein QGN28_19455 [Mycobacterium sp. 5-140-3-1]
MTRRRATLIAFAAVVAIIVLKAITTAGAAHAGPPPPPPTPPGSVECNGQLIPADPRLDVQNPMGAVMYRWFLQQMCAAGTPPAPPPNM